MLTALRQIADADPADPVAHRRAHGLGVRGRGRAELPANVHGDGRHREPRGACDVEGAPAAGARHARRARSIAARVRDRGARTVQREGEAAPGHGVRARDRRAARSAAVRRSCRSWVGPRSSRRSSCGLRTTVDGDVGASSRSSATSGMGKSRLVEELRARRRTTDAVHDDPLRGVRVGCAVRAVLGVAPLPARRRAERAPRRRGAATARGR